MPTKRTIIINRNGQTHVITGWRAWLLSLGTLLFAWLVLALVVFLLAGIATTAGIALLLLIPALAVVAVLGSIFGRR